MSKLLLILFLLLPFSPFSLPSDDFPALFEWTNSLSDEQQVKTFLQSPHDFAREVVSIRTDQSESTPHAYLGLSATYQLSFGLNLIKQGTRGDRQVMLEFRSLSDYRDALGTLQLFNETWLWFFFPIVKGPNNDREPFKLEELLLDGKKQAMIENLQTQRLAFGFTTDKNYGSGEYLREKMEALANAMDEWYTKIGCRDSFMMELSLHVLLNTNDHARVIRPFLDRTVMVNFVTPNSNHDKMIVQRKGNLKALARMFGKKRVYLNVPRQLRDRLDLNSWFGNSTSAAGRHGVSVGGHGGEGGWMKMEVFLWTAIYLGMK